MNAEYTQTTSMIVDLEKQCLVCERDFRAVFEEYGRGDYLKADKRCQALRNTLHWMSEQTGTLAVCISSQWVR